jgi:hypothetical protein
MSKILVIGGALGLSTYVLLLIVVVASYAYLTKTDSKKPTVSKEVVLSILKNSKTSNLVVLQQISNASLAISKQMKISL